MGPGTVTRRIVGRIGGRGKADRPLFQDAEQALALYRERLPAYRKADLTVDIAPADIRRERIGLPLLRDERPELQLRELERIVRERAGLAEDSTEPGG